MRRTSAGGDARLHERWSIGVGGHVGPDDGGIEAGLQREFHEELVADWQPQPRLLGLLNDDRTPVGRVHLGIVFEAEAAGRAVAVRETHKLVGRVRGSPRRSSAATSGSRPGASCSSTSCRSESGRSPWPASPVTPALVAR